MLVQADGAGKIADFGLALPEGPPPYPLPAPVPTVVEAPPDGGVAADLYAATCVFVECLTGRPPQDDTLRKVPGSVRELVADGLSPDPARRPATAREFIEALERAAGAAYGAEWEKRGRRHLAELATPLALHFPLAGPAPGPRTRNARPPGARSTGLGLLPGRGGGERRRPRTRPAHLARPRFAVIAALAAAAVTTIVLTSDRGPADGAPDTFLATPPRSPETEAAGPPPTLPVRTPETANTGQAATGPPAEKPAQNPAVAPSKAASPVAHRVGSLRVSGFDGVRGTIVVAASTGGKVTVTAGFAEGRSRDHLADAPPQTFTLSGSTAYATVVTHTFAPPPCEVTVYRRLTVTTVPGGGTASRTATVRGPACAAPAVLEVRVLSWNGSAGTARVTTDGPGPVRLGVSFTRREGDGPARTVHTDTRTLKGRTTYTVEFGRAPEAITCGDRAHLGVLVSTVRAAATGPQISEAALDGPACPQPSPTGVQPSGDPGTAVPPEDTGASPAQDRALAE